jgi:hypothetical protein
MRPRTFIAPELGLMRQGRVNSVLQKSAKTYATRTLFVPIIQMWDRLFRCRRFAPGTREKQLEPWTMHIQSARSKRTNIRDWRNPKNAYVIAVTVYIKRTQRRVDRDARMRQTNPIAAGSRGENATNEPNGRRPRPLSAAPRNEPSIANRSTELAAWKWDRATIAFCEANP